MKEVMLSSTVSIERYQEMVKEKDKKAIVEFIKQRFRERYIDPVKKSRSVHGFAIMALSCLMIEALQSFLEGLPNTKRYSKTTFRNFFKKCREWELDLGVFNDWVEDFYEGVRCGLLHQAETTSGWRIRRDCQLFDKRKKMINAQKFLKGLEKYLEKYCDELQQADWDSEIWQNLREKMKYVIENCEIPDQHQS